MPSLRARCLVLLVLLMSSALAFPGHVALAKEARPSGAPASATATETSGGGGALTPEEAVRRYLSGVATADLEAVLSVSAIDAFGERFRFDQLVEWRGAYTPGLDPSPPSHAFFQELNRLKRAETIGRKITNLAYSLLTSEDLAERGIGPWPIRVEDGTWTRSFVGQVDPTRLAQMDVSDIRFPDVTLEDDSRWLDAAEREARILGADELTQRLALISFGDRSFDVGFTLVRYGDEWQVFDQASSLAGTDSWGAARPTTLEEFEERTSSGKGAS